MNFLAAIRVRVYRGVGINILRVALAAMQHRILMIACSLSLSLSLSLCFAKFRRILSAYLAKTKKRIEKRPALFSQGKKR